MSCYVKKYHQNLVADQQFTQPLIMLLQRVISSKNSQKKIEEGELTVCHKVIL